MGIPYRGSGKVLFSAKEYKCALYYSEDSGSIAINIFNETESGVSSFLELPLEITELSGRLESGYKFTLINLTRDSMNDNLSSRITTFTYCAEYMISGISNAPNENVTFSKIGFVLSDIIDWGGQSIYFIGDNYELRHKESNVSVNIYEGDKYTLRYKVSGSYLPCSEMELLKETIELKQHGIIELEFTNEQILKDIVPVFNSIKRLIEISVLSQVNVEKMYGYSKKIVDTYGDKKYERQIDIYGNSIKTENNILRPHKYNWITLSELVANNAIEQFLIKQEKLEPIIELFVELFYLKNSSITRVFLNAVQALETYHSRFVTNDLAVFKKRVDRLASMASATNAQYVKNFIMANSKKFVTLESRLADLLYAEGSTFFDTGDIKREDFPSVIAHTRNYYIHYDEEIKKKYKVFSPEELEIYNAVLFKMLEHYIFLELGFPVQDIKKKHMTRWRNVSRDLQIIKQSKDIEKKARSANK